MRDDEGASTTGELVWLGVDKAPRNEVDSKVGPMVLTRDVGRVVGYGIEEV